MELQKLPISLIMIVRNSDGRLEKVINAHRDIVSEVIVVDQSSEDGTWETAQKFADFAVKRRNKGKCEGDRNFAFQLGSQPWVLNLDDDEFIQTSDKEKLSKVLNSGADAVWFKRKNLVDGVEMKFMGDDPQCRLFKRGAIRWSDVTHTYAEKAANALVYHSDITIEHIRSYKQILETHSRRSKVLEPEKLELERGFIQAVGSELRKSGNFKD